MIHTPLGSVHAFFVAAVATILAYLFPPLRDIYRDVRRRNAAKRREAQSRAAKGNASNNSGDTRQ